MTIEALQLIAPQFAAVVFRFAGLMLFAPFLGSNRIPKPVKLMMAVVLAAGLFANGGPRVPIPDDVYTLTMGIGGEILFGFALGMAASLVFVGAQWAGEAVGQQMGLGIGQVFNPDAEVGGGVLEQAYFLLTLFIFLLIGGHRMLVAGVYESFEVLPPLTVGVDAHVLDVLVGLLVASCNMAIRLAAPMFAAMLTVDLCLGFVGKTMPQMNLLSAGLSLRALVGMGMVTFIVAVSGETISDELHHVLGIVFDLYTGVEVTVEQPGEVGGG